MSNMFNVEAWKRSLIKEAKEAPDGVELILQVTSDNAAKAGLLEGQRIDDWLDPPRAVRVHVFDAVQRTVGM